MTAPFLNIEPLSKSAFSPFGTVIETEGAKRLPINQGTTTRFDALAAVDVATDGGSPIISLFRGVRRLDPISIRLLERHPLGSQAFYPLVDAEWLVVVANGTMDDTAPDFSSLRCFLASGMQGVSYARGTWHHPLLVLLPEQDFLVVDRVAPEGETPGQNFNEVWFDDRDGVAALIPEIKSPKKKY